MPIAGILILHNQLPVSAPINATMRQGISEVPKRLVCVWISVCLHRRLSTGYIFGAGKVKFIEVANLILFPLVGQD